MKTVSLKGPNKFFMVGLFCFMSFVSYGYSSEKVVLQLKWHHQFQFAGYYAAVHQGYYEEEGLEVELREGENVDTITEVLSGNADFGIASSDLVLSFKQNKPVVALATVFQHSPLVLIRTETSASGTLHDVEGDRVMLEAHSEELLAYLVEMGVSIQTLTRFPYQNALQSLISGEVDAISGYITDEPFHLRQQGFPFQMSSPRAVGIDFYGDTLFTSRARVAQDPEIVKKFRRASMRGWEYALQNPDELITYILEKWPENNSREALEYEAVQIQKLIRNDLVEIGYMNPGRWEHIAGVYADLGLATGQLDLDAFLYTEQQNFPWRKILPVAIPLFSLLMLSVFMAFYQRKLRRVQSESYLTLNDLKQKISNLLENMPGMAYQCHNDGKDWVLEYVSDGARELTGYSQTELVGSSGLVFGDLIHPEDADRVSETVQKATANKTTFRVEYRIRHLDGSTRWVWEQGKQVDSDKEDSLLEGFICDISDRKHSESEKELAVQRLQKVIDEIKTLRGIIPICASCKNIRNDTGAWEQLEAYIKKHTDANFSHGICPECVQRLYPELKERKKE
jgi:PAS domain S-box-containing protein